MSPEYVPSPRCQPGPGHPGLYIMEPDFAGLELRMMEVVRREEERRRAEEAARRPLVLYRPVLPPFWPSRPSRG